MLPSEDIFILRCNALNLPSSFFEQQTVNLKEVEFRKLTKLSAKKQKQIREDAADFLSRYVELEKLMGVLDRFENPFGERPVVKTRDDAEKYALQLRKLWKLGTHPIQNVTELLEAKHLKVQEISVDAKFEGMAAMAEYEGIPHYVVVINAFDRPSVRKRLTCLHELAHLCFDLSHIKDERLAETLCHHAAGALLLPEKELKDMIDSTRRKKIAVRELVAVKEKFGIALSAVLFRLQYFGIITDSYAKSQFRYFSMKKWRGPQEPGNYPVKEYSARMSLLLDRGVEEGIISISKAAHLAGKTTDEFMNDTAYR